MLMNRARDHFLAGAAFTDDEDIDSEVAYVSDELKNLPHPGALTDDIVESIPTVNLLAEPFDLALQAVLLERTGDLNKDFICAERLGHIVERSCVHGFHRTFYAPKGRNQKNQCMSIDLSKLSNQFGSPHARH